MFVTFAIQFFKEKKNAVNYIMFVMSQIISLTKIASYLCEQFFLDFVFNNK